MSAKAESEEATATEEATTEQPEGDEDGKPDITEEDRAEIDLSAVAEDIEDTVGDSVDDEESEEADTDDGESSEGETTPDTEKDSSDEAAAPDGETWGDMYVEVVAVLIAEGVDQYAGEDADADRMTAEDVANLARQPPVNLPRQVDRLAAEMGTAEDLPPGQAVVISTGLLAVVVLAKETDIMGDLLGEVMDR